MCTGLFERNFFYHNWPASVSDQIQDFEALLSMCAALQGYAPIRQDYEDFYTRRMFYRIHVSPSASSTKCCFRN